MMNRLQQAILTLCALLAVLPAAAQSADYNPKDPPEPFLKYDLTVKVEPSAAATVSGAGTYSPGQSVSVKVTRTYTNYQFKCWKVNGEEQTETAKQLNLTMPDKPTEVVAVFDYTYVEPPFDPKNPAEPQVIPEEPPVPPVYNLFLEAVPADGGTFSRVSGATAQGGELVSVTAKAATNFVFAGWYDGEKRLSETATVQYTMPEANATLTARFTYNPGTPAEPSTPDGQGSVQNELVKTDLNKDGKEDMTDLMLIVNYIAGKPDKGVTLETVDVNGDKRATIADIIVVTNSMKK